MVPSYPELVGTVDISDCRSRWNLSGVLGLLAAPCCIGNTLPLGPMDAGHTIYNKHIVSPKFHHPNGLDRVHDVNLLVV
jgi:hypothetical protein